MTWFRTRSLRTKLLLASLLVQVLMLGLLVFNNSRIAAQALQERVELYNAELATLFNAALAAPLAERDYATLSDILKEIQHTAGVSYLVLSERSGQRVVSAGWPSDRPLPVAQAHLDFAGARADVLDLSLVVELNGVPYGTLAYGLSVEHLSRTRTDLLRQSLLIGVAGLAVSLLLLSVLAYFLTRHLKRLSQASQRVIGGDFSVRLPEEAGDEIGQLTRAFNRMSEAIEERIEALQVALVDLKVADESRRHHLASSEEERARLLALLGAMNLGILFVTAENQVKYCNTTFLRIWMIPEEVELVGKSASEVLAYSTNELARPDHFSRHLLEVLETHEMSSSFEISLSDGRVVTQLSYPVRDADGRFIGRLWIYEDVTRERQTAEQLIYLAERDALTGLYNRRRFEDELARFLKESDRHRRQGALLFFDLDEFKYINDTFGHRAGDSVLIRVAGEVGALTRKNEVFSRLGGDEFGVLMPDATEDDAIRLAERIVRAVSQIPFRLEGHNLRLTTSLGIAHYPQNATNAEELVAHADAAMYQAKEAGKNAWAVYRAERDASREMISRLSWNDRIDRAFEKGLWRLNFQGVYHAGNGELSHLEVLIRLVDETHVNRMIMPGHFISYAEKNGKILEIDRWVLSQSIALLAKRPHMPPLAVNISGRSFDQPALPHFIEQELGRHGVHPDRLLVELTETSAVSDLQDAERFIEALRRTGCGTCLDDFGTGFASFAYLKHLKADLLKIDGLFIRDLPNDRDNQVFVKSIVDVARGLSKRTVAEFVENEETLAMLRQFGVDMVQGYYLDKPQEMHPAVVGPTA